MREVAFIKQNKEKWLDFEQAIFGKAKKNPDEMASLYIHLVNDLSYAQTYYPKSKTVVYLNYLAAQIYQKIYKTKRTETNRFVYFFFYRSTATRLSIPKICFVCISTFFLTTTIGAVSAKYDPDFVRLIMGDGYVNKTLDNIKDGNPVAIYKDGSNWGMTIGITLNNLYVGLRCFLYGIFAGLGTFYILIKNCIMLGAFQYFFYEQGVFWESVRGIWIHGSMEIFAIVIEAAAGFILGASILFPKTYSRMASFKIGFKSSLKIFLGTMPFTIGAGILEGFVTRYSLEMPNWLNVLIILSTLSLISFLFLSISFYSQQKNTIRQMIALFKKRNFNDYLNDTFSFFKKDGKHFLKNYFVINGIFLLLLVVFMYFLSKIYFEAIFSTLDNTNPGYNFAEDLFSENFGLFITSLIGFILLSLFLTLLNFAYPVIYLEQYDKNLGTGFETKDIINGLKSKIGKMLLFFIITLFLIIPVIAVLFTVLIFLSFIIIGIPLMIIAFPVLFSLMTLTFYDYLTTENGYFTSLGNAIGYLKKQFWPIVGVTMLMYMIVQIIMSIFSMIPYVIAMVILFTSIENNTTGPTQDALSTFSIIMTVIFVTIILTNYILNNLLVINQGMIYYSRREHDENNVTFSEIDTIGTNFE